MFGKKILTKCMNSYLMTNFQKELVIIGSGWAAKSIVDNLPKKILKSTLVVDNLSRSKINQYSFQPPENYLSPAINHSILGGSSKIWHGVLGSLDRYEESHFKKANPHVVRGKNFASDFFKISKKSLESEYEDNYSVRPYFTPYITSRLGKKDFQDIALKDFYVKTFSKSENGLIKLTSYDKETIFCKKLIIAAGALGSTEIILRSLGLYGEENGVSFTDHAISPIGISKLSSKKTEEHFFKSHLKAKNNSKGHFKYSIDSLPNPTRDERFSIFFRKSLFNKISLREEKIRNSIVSFRSNGLSYKDIKNIFLNPNILISLLALKVGVKGLGSYNQVFCLSTQDREPNRLIYLDKKENLHLNWHVTDKEVSRKINFAKNLLNAEFESFDSEDIKKVTGGSAHITSNLVKFVGKDEESIKFIDNSNVYIIGSSTFSKPILSNNTLAIVSQAISFAREELL